MADITQTITVYSGAVPDASNMTQGEFDSAAVQLTNYWQIIPGELNAWASQANGLKSDVNSTLGIAENWATLLGPKVDGSDYSAKEYAIGLSVGAGSAKQWATHLGSTVDGAYYSARHYADIADLSARSAAATAHYGGDWSSLTGAAAPPFTVSHLGNVWFLKDALADVTASEPGHTNSDWFSLGGLAYYDLGVTVQPYDPNTSKTNVAETFTGKKTLQEADIDLLDVREVRETVHTLTGTSPMIDPANGTIQTWTLTGNSSPSANFDSGQFVLLLIDDGSSRTINWSGVIASANWVPLGEPPPLEESSWTRVVLWKIGTTVYGAY